MTENYYDILCVPQNATHAEIKAAYRRLVLKFHPDKNINDTAAAQRFRKIRIAYETLIHPDKRREYDNVIAGKNKRRNIFHTRRAFSAIRIYPSRRVVNLGDTIELLAVCDLPCQRFFLGGLEQFEIISGPEYAVDAHENRKSILIRYKVKPLYTGYIPIGPAWAIYDNIKFESEKIYLKVKEKGAPIYRFDLSRGENIFYLAVIAFFIFLFGLTFYNIRERGLMPDELLLDEAPKRKYRGAEIPLQLSTGITPYPSLHDTLFSQPSSGHVIKIINSKYQDAVVFVLESKSRKTVRNHYIRAKESYEITHLPDGNYFIKVMFGNDWNSKKGLKGTRLTGGFSYNQRYEIFDNLNQTITLRHQISDNQILHSKYEIKLFPAPDGNVASNPVTEQKFFNY